MWFKRMGCVALALLLASVSAQQSAAAQQDRAKPNDAEPKAEQVVKVQQKALDTTKFAKAPDDEKSQEPALGVRKWRQLQQQKRLRAAILERVNLTAEQRARIEETFERFFREAHENRGWGRLGPKAHPVLTPDEKIRLEYRLAEAEKAGDHSAAEQIRLEIAKGTPGSGKNLIPSTKETLLAELAQHIRPDQMGAFNAVVDRWNALECRSPLDGPLRMLRRATSDPELKLTAEQQKAIENIINIAKAGLPPPDKRTPEIKNAAAEKARADIFKLINTEQRAQVDATIALFKQQDIEREKYRIQRNLERSNERPPPVLRMRKEPAAKGDND